MTQLSAEHAQALADIHAEAFETPKPWDAASICASLASPYAFLLESANGFLIGSALAGEVELLTVAVAKQARRQGQGRQLMLQFIAAAKAREAQTAFLEVSAENPAAITLYESFGFTKAGVRKGYYTTPNGDRIDAIVMSAVL